MAIRRALIIVPTLLLVFLLHSYFWVPTYEEQTRGNPDRLNEYITASIGDASLINPVLSSDSASSAIEGMVFEGLIDRDEELRFRGRLATGWRIFEEAYFFVNPRYPIPGVGPLETEATAAWLRAQRASADRPQALRHVTAINVIPPQRTTAVRRRPDPATPGKTTETSVVVDAPARIQLVLDRVDQELFTNLAALLGNGYFASFDGRPYLHSATPAAPETLSDWAADLLPATEHNPVLLFDLRPGVRFHDGHLFDADDVRFTFDAIMNPKNLSPRISDYEPVKAVTVVSPLKVRIVYKRLYSPAINTWAMGILPEHRLNAAALAEEALRRGRDPDTFSIRDSEFNRRPIGCGPFTFAEWKSDQYIALERFEDYWEGPPNYQRYIYRIVPDLLTQEMEFYAGTVDTYSVQPHQVERLKADPRFQNFSGTAFGYTYIGYNLRRPPFDDPRVRRALGMAIDVDQIIAYVLYGEGERITGPFVRQTDYYNPDIAPLPYDPRGALELLQAAGWQRGADGWLAKDGRRLQFTLITNSGNDLRKAVLAIAQDAWKQIGIDVRTDLLEWSVFIQERVNKADFDALVLGWQMGIEPDLYQIWHSSQANPYQLNFVGFRNAEADDLIVKIRQEYDYDRQVAFCRRLHEIIADAQPYTFLYVSKWTAILDRRIVIKTVNAAGDVRYTRIQPTKTGNFTFHFNQWIKLPSVPQLGAEG